LAAVPLAPSNLTVTASQAHNVTLNWDSDASPSVNYRLYVATGATGKFNLAGTADWTLLATVTRSAGTTTYSYTGHTAEDFAWYHVRAFDGTGESTPSPLGFKLIRHLRQNTDRGNLNWVSLPKRSIYAQASDIEIHARDILKTRALLNKILAERTGQPLEKIERDTERDFFLSADEAKDYGLVDQVIARRA